MLQRVIDRGLSVELEAHLGYERHDKAADGRRADARNGTTSKRLKGTFGAIEVNTPQDRAGTFEPVLVKKRQTRLGDFEDKIMVLYARGMSTRDIESALVDLYGGPQISKEAQNICVDPPGVNRVVVHRQINADALAFLRDEFHVTHCDAAEAILPRRDCRSDSLPGTPRSEVAHVRRQ